MGKAPFDEAVLLAALLSRLLESNQQNTVLYQRTNTYVDRMRTEMQMAARAGLS